MSKRESTASAAAIEARNLAASYDGPQVLSNVTFSIPAGKTIAILGPNGSGKSTLFKAILGELEPVHGEVKVSASVAYVPQNDHSRLDFPVSALDVALMGCYPSLPWWRRISQKQRDQALAALKRVGMSELAKTHFGSLSGGQRQRVLIARALAQDADLLLLDEPYAHVDPTSAARIDLVLHELRAEGHTALITTHDVEQARAWDLVLCLNTKQIAFGPPSQVLTAQTLQATYGKELIVLSGDQQGHAITVQHHSHD